MLFKGQPQKQKKNAHPQSIQKLSKDHVNSSGQGLPSSIWLWKELDTPFFCVFCQRKIKQHHLSGTAVQNLSLLAVVEGKVWTCQWCIMVKPLHGNPVPAKTIMATKLAARKIIECFCALHWKISLNVQCMFELSISVFQSCQHIAAPKMNRMVGQLVTAKYYHILPASFHQSFHQHESLTYAGSQQPVEWIYSSAQSCKGKGQPYDRSWPFST